LGAQHGECWRRWIDTALDSPADIVPWQEAAAVPGHVYRAQARSVVVLFASPQVGTAALQAIPTPRA